jgi:hypothetical protein
MSLNNSETGNDLPGKNAGLLQRFFTRPLFLSLTIGVPFCIFKLLLGISAVRTGSGTSMLLSAGGWLIICWALADLVMNLGREVYDLVDRPAPFEYCTIAQVGRFFDAPLVFLAFDTLLTFTIICTMLWSGWIARLSSTESVLWYAATTLNLISLSLVVLYNEIRALPGKTDP